MVEKHTIPLEDLFKAYYSCRKNKRNTINALAFELNLEEELIQLKEELESGRYAISSSIAFVVDKPIRLFFLASIARLKRQLNGSYFAYGKP
jgi:RNA-directed DNA polymerase